MNLELSSCFDNTQFNNFSDSKVLQKILHLRSFDLYLFGNQSQLALWQGHMAQGKVRLRLTVPTELPNPTFLDFPQKTQTKKEKVKESSFKQLDNLE